MANEIQKIQNTVAQQGEIILYQPDETVRIEVRLEDETVWLNRQQMATLFGRDVKTIGKHVNNALKEELKGEKQVIAKFATTAADGKTYQVEHYGLDMVMSVGYRVKSSRGIEFRQWANRVLKEYILRGYALNQRAMIEKKEIDSRLVQHEQRIEVLENKVEFFVHTSLPPVEGIFFDGQVFDAYHFVSDLIRKAKKRIVLIDNYIDDTVLTVLDKREAGVSTTIYTQHVGQQLQLDLDRHNAQYAPITVEHFNRAHDRFLMIDDEVYHIGASLKDLGKKWFAFTLLSDITTSELLSKM